MTPRAVVSPPRPMGPSPVMLMPSKSSASSLARSGSGCRSPIGRQIASFASFMQRSAVPPIPTPTTVGGHGLPPASTTPSRTKRLIPAALAARLHPPLEAEALDPRHARRRGEHPEEGHVLRAGALRHHAELEGVAV